MSLRTREHSVRSPALSRLKADLRSMSDFHAPATVKTGSNTTLVESRAAAQGIEVKQRNFPFVPKNRILLGIGLRYVRTFATAVNPLLRVASLAYDIWKLQQEAENNIFAENGMTAGSGWYIHRFCTNGTHLNAKGFSGYATSCASDLVSTASSWSTNEGKILYGGGYWYANMHSNVRPHPNPSYILFDTGSQWRIDQVEEPEPSTYPQHRKRAGFVLPYFMDDADYYSHWIPTAFPEQQPINGSSPNKRAIPYALRPYFRYMHPDAPYIHGHYELQPSLDLSHNIPAAGLPYVADPVEITFGKPEMLTEPKGFPAYHNRQKAPAHQMERKVQIRTATGQAVYRVVSDVGEAIDIVDELYSALPNRLKARYPNTRYAFKNPPTITKIRAIYEARNEVDDDFVAQAIENLLVMKVEDALYGKLGQLNAAASEKVFRWSGRGFQTGGWVRRKF